MKFTYRLWYHVPPKPPAWSTITKSLGLLALPSVRARAARHNPPNPAPKIAILTCPPSGTKSAYQLVVFKYVSKSGSVSKNKGSESWIPGQWIYIPGRWIGVPSAIQGSSARTYSAVLDLSRYWPSPLSLRRLSRSCLYFCWSLREFVMLICSNGNQCECECAEAGSWKSWRPDLTRQTSTTVFM